MQIANECSASADTVVVGIDDTPPAVDLPATINLCDEETIVIDAGVAGVSYLWNNLSQSSSIAVSDPGLYSVTVSNSCGMDIDSVEVIDIGSAPTVSLGPELSLCPGDVVVLSPASSDVISWLWHDGSTGTSFEVSSAGTVTVQVSNDCGVSVDSILITMLPDIPVFSH